MRVRENGGRIEVVLDDPELRLTPAQRSAVRIDRELVVSAGAGSGKTHTLALRFVLLLLERACDGSDDVQDVLVLTFTEKAATEMADRCRARLIELIHAIRRDLPGQTDVRSRLERMADGFERARIGTFHGFCRVLLAEYPTRTGTAPVARVWSGPESALAAEVALDKELRAFLADEPAALHPMLDAFSDRAGLLRAGRLALERLGVLEPTLRAHATGRLGLAEAIRTAPLSPAEVTRALDEEVLPTLRLLVRLTSPSGGGPFVRNVLRPLLDATEPLEPLARNAWYHELLACVTTDDGSARRLDHHTVLGPRSTWPDRGRADQARRAATVLQSRIADWPLRTRTSERLPTPADAAMYAALAPFSRWVLRASDRLEQTLDRASAVTFDRLQLRAARAVADNALLRTELRDRFRYLMVDEFQDTDEVQWELVLALARADRAVPEDRLFVVGDPKQAIYGFRGGDVTVYRRAIEALGAESVHLAENFRSRPELVRWFDTTFARILGTTDAPFDTPYEAAAVGRTEPGGTVDLAIHAEPLGGPHCVAAWIADLLLERADLASPSAHPVPPVAVLLRTRTHQRMYEAALTRAGIPFVVPHGVSFWLQRSVIDLVLALAAVAHADPVARIGFARSPLGGWTDQELTDLGAKGRSSLGTVSVDPLSDAAPEDLASWTRLRHEVPPSELVRRMARALLPALTLEDPSGRAEANAAHLVEIVRAWDPLGPIEAASLAMRAVDDADRASEAVLQSSRARVVLCTIHAAKGLEFPVVVVPELHARPRGDHEPIRIGRLEGERRWRLAAQVTDPGADVQTRVSPGLYAALRSVAARERDAEDRRLLYVATTRARDRLLLVGRASDDDEPGARPTWLQLIEPTTPKTPSPTALSPESALAPQGAAPPSSRGPLRRSAPPVVIGPSALDAFVACPARWYRSSVLGLTETPLEPIDRARALARARGSVLHEILQDGLVDEPARIEARWRRAAAELAATDEEREGGRARMLRIVEALKQNDGVRRALDAEGASEVSFRAEHAGVTLRGRIDRVWRDASGDGRFVVLDWKTTTLYGGDALEVAERSLAQLRGYAWAADRALLAHGGPGVGRMEVVLLDTGAVMDLGAFGPPEAALVTRDLEAIARVAASPFDQVEREATASAAPRPCTRCGFRGRGCRGQPA